MSVTLTALAVSLLFSAPQEPAAGPGPSAAPEPVILSSSEVKGLNKKAISWMKAWRKWHYEASSKTRPKYMKSMNKAREAFIKEWDSKSKKGDLLASVPDCEAVFANCFEYERMSTSGKMKTVKASGAHEADYALVAARGYDPSEGYRSVFVIPGWDQARENWTPSQEWYDATWGGAGIGDETLFVLPQLDNGLELDGMPKQGDPTSDAKERDRVKAILGAAGRVQRDFNLDRQRMILDCGRGSNAFGLRLASYFPDRFCGVVLRDPSAVTDELRIGSLVGLPILMILDADNKATGEALIARIDAAGGSAVTVLEAKGEYPYLEMQAEINDWVAARRRQLNRQLVVIEPNSDFFNDAYWVQVGTAEPLANTALEDQPRMKVSVDREANRIEIEARGISDFTLLLNDEIADLDKPFTVVINGVAEKQTRERSLKKMVERLQNRFDPSYVFVAEASFTVPTPPEDESASESKSD